MSLQAQTFPGIYFETVHPAVQDTLPRMDIASFVGFASSGPLHTPVVVESAQQFREVFGADVSLAWDDVKNQVEQSYLGLAVESFFRNGGRRCWVVRVADEDMAQTASFVIPGLIRTNSKKVETANAEARSAGGWADSVSVSSVLQVEQLKLVNNEIQVASTPSLKLTADSWYIDVIAIETQVVKGDLISVNLLHDDSMLYLFVDSITDIEYGVRLSGTYGYFYTPDTGSSPVTYDVTKAIPSFLESDDFLLFNLKDLNDLGIPKQWPDESTTVPTVRLLRYELLTRGPAGRQQRLTNLAFESQQNRFWGLLPADEDLYREKEGKPVRKYSVESKALLEEASIPRFPLAAPADVADWHYLPIGMNLLVNDAEQSRAEYESEMTRLQREGIENFGSQIFLDQRLQHIRGDLVKQQAHEIAYLNESTDSKPLKGIHSLLLINEASIVAVPDAVHRRWDSLSPEFELPLAAPDFLNISTTEELNEYNLDWEHESNLVVSPDNIDMLVLSYTLEWSNDPDFKEANRVQINADALPRVGEPLDLIPPPVTEYRVTIRETCIKTYYFRVRAEREGEVSPWSNNKVLHIPETDFLDCQFVQAHTLELTLIATSSDLALDSPTIDQQGHILSWEINNSETEDETIDYFELQRASDRLFTSHEVIFYGSVDELEDPEKLEFFIEDIPDSIYYYRIRAISRKSIGPWSNTLTIWPVNLSQTTLVAKSDYSNLDILAIHRALLRSCYARGNLFAVLSLPRHYEVQDVLDHYALLKPGVGDDDIGTTTYVSVSDSYGANVPALSTAEESVTSHASIYYPWVLTSTESNGQGKLEHRSVTPDGVVIGKIAARAIAQGAWIAPANSPLTDVLALENKINDLQWQQLTQSNINVIRQAPSGYILLSANTLSINSEYREINVRRLMSLLLRVALREGDRYVFEPNNAVFQERVQQHFETVFAKLFKRGAFAGSTASQAYRVVTDSSVNTAQSIEHGRFIVELHVAPSRALKFIRIRLLQSGPDQLQVQEVA